jgi:hypothetical protein
MVVSENTATGDEPLAHSLPSPIANAVIRNYTTLRDPWEKEPFKRAQFTVKVTAFVVQPPRKVNDLWQESFSSPEVI